LPSALTDPLVGWGRSECRRVLLLLLLLLLSATGATTTSTRLRMNDCGARRGSSCSCSGGGHELGTKAKQQVAGDDDAGGSILGQSVIS